jgi:uncharacterized membrane protein YgcG
MMEKTSRVLVKGENGVGGAPSGLGVAAGTTRVVMTDGEAARGEATRPNGETAAAMLQIEKEKKLLVYKAIQEAIDATIDCFEDDDKYMGLEEMREARMKAREATSFAFVNMIEAITFKAVGEAEIQRLITLLYIRDNDCGTVQFHFNIEHILESLATCFPAMEDSQANLLGYLLSENIVLERLLSGKHLCYLFRLCRKHTNASYFLTSAFAFFAAQMRLIREWEQPGFVVQELLSLVKFLIKECPARSSPWLTDMVHMCGTALSDMHTGKYMYRGLMGDEELTRSFIKLLDIPVRGKITSEYGLPTLHPPLHPPFAVPIAPRHQFCLMFVHNYMFRDVDGPIEIAEAVWGFSLRRDNHTFLRYEDCAEVFYQESMPKSSAKRSLPGSSVSSGSSGSPGSSVSSGSSGSPGSSASSSSSGSSSELGSLESPLKKARVVCYE